LGRRGPLTDETLTFIDRCFADDVVEANGQPFLFRPRPPRPPIFIGGAPPHAFRRAVAHRAGWMPMGLAPEQIPPLAAGLRARAKEAGLDAPPIAVLTTLPLDDGAAARDRLARYAEAGGSVVIHGARYPDAGAFKNSACESAAGSPGRKKPTGPSSHAGRPPSKWAGAVATKKLSRIACSSSMARVSQARTRGASKPHTGAAAMAFRSASSTV